MVRRSIIHDGSWCYSYFNGGNPYQVWIQDDNALVRVFCDLGDPEDEHEWDPKSNNNLVVAYENPKTVFFGTRRGRNRSSAILVELHPREYVLIQEKITSFRTNESIVSFCASGNCYEYPVGVSRNMVYNLEQFTTMEKRFMPRFRSREDWIDAIYLATTGDYRNWASRPREWRISRIAHSAIDLTDMHRNNSRSGIF